MYVLLEGDAHGDMEWFHDVVLRRAIDANATKIVQLGDFGFVWPRPNYGRTLDKMNRLLDRANIDLHFLPGNHEDFDKLELLTARKSNTVSPEGHIPFRPRIFYTGKVSAWTWAGHRFAAVGGATSIDKHWRVPGESWWPQEALTPAEAAAARALGRTEVLLTHDAPTSVPFRLQPDADSTAHRQVMTDIARVLKPQVWFHGHYHQYEKYPFVHDAGVCEVTSLDCNGSPWSRGTELLVLPGLR